MEEKQRTMVFNVSKVVYVDIRYVWAQNSDSLHKSISLYVGGMKIERARWVFSVFSLLCNLCTSGKRSRKMFSF